MGGTHKCGLYLQSESCALPDVLNRAAVIRNEQIRIQIFGSAPDTPKKRSRFTVVMLLRNLCGFNLPSRQKVPILVTFGC